MTGTFGGIYNTGTMTLTNGSGTAAFSGTLMTTEAAVGDFIYVNPLNLLIYVNAVTDDTHLAITPNWGGTTQTAIAYTLLKISPLRYDPAITQQKLRDMLAFYEAIGMFYFVSGAAPDPGIGIDGQWALKTNVTPWQIWYHTGGIWVAQSNGANISTTSTTSLSIATGTKAFTTVSALSLTTGTRMRAASNGSPNNWMEGVATISGTAVTLNVDKIGGSGTFTDWNLNIAGSPGAGDLLSSNNLSDVVNKLTAANNLQVISYGGAQTLTATQQDQAQKNIAMPLAIYGHITGLTMSTAGSTSFSIATGVATSEDATDIIVSSSTIAKTTAAWTAGSGNGGIDSGSIAANTWYHVFVIKNPTTQVVDALFSTSLNPIMPSGYTLRRRIGSIKTNGSSNWTLFTQVDDEFHWSSNVVELGGFAPSNTLGNTVNLVGVPGGIVVSALFHGAINPGAGANGVLFTSLDEADVAVLSATGSRNASLWAQTSGAFQAGDFSKRTNTSAAFRWRVFAASGDLSIYTYGWIDRRGKG